MTLLYRILATLALVVCDLVEKPHRRRYTERESMLVKQLHRWSAGSKLWSSEPAEPKESQRVVCRHSPRGQT